MHEQTSQNNETVSRTLEDLERLPRLDLPDFSGDFKEWESFRDVFYSTMISKPRIPNVTKLRHLRAHLKGDTSDLVSSYALTDENFQLVWDKLKNRYENKKRLINSHVAVNFAIPPMVKASAVDLKKILVSLNTPLAALRVLGRPVDTWDDLLILHTISLFNGDTKRQWEFYLSNLSLSASSMQLPNQNAPPVNDDQTCQS